MVVVRSTKFALTLLCNITLAVFTITSVLAIDPLTPNVHRREHAALNRMMKIRSPDSFGLEPVQNIAENPAAVSSSSAASSAPAVQASGSSASASPTSVPSAVFPLPLSISVSNTASLSLASSTSLSSTASSNSSSASSTQSSSPTSASAPDASAIALASPTAFAENGGIITVTSHVSVDATATGSSVPAPKGDSNLSHGAITVLIVIGSCVGGGAVLWTIFRKWKLRASSRFEDRLEPISWQPTAEGDIGIPGQNRRASVASSFHSAGHDGIMRSNSSGAYGSTGYGAAGQASHNSIPDHDFTAGVSHLAPVGGYADLARGPSPQPQMQDLSRDPSFNRAYDYGASMHNQGGTVYDYNTPRY